MTFVRPVHSAVLALALTTLAGLSVQPAAAAPHRARLGQDLEERLAKGSQSIDVIVHGTQAEVAALARRYNVRVRRSLKGGAVLGVNAGQLDAMAQDPGVDHLASDAPVHTSSIITEGIGADQVWAGTQTMRGVTGRGVGVAVIDSGMDARHPALAGRIVATKDFIGGDGSDAYGHGTHVAGLIAGAAGRTADTADYIGVAPAARLINLRVLDGTGAGRMSDVIEAIDWAIDNQRAYNIRVINLSLGAPVLQSYKDDPLCEAVERAVSNGLIVVAAAGNFGQTKDGKTIFGGITSPGNDPAAITVGAVDQHGTAKRSDDTLAPYSSHGPTLFDMVIKPDLVAPGTKLVSAEAAGSYLATRYPEKHVAGAANAGYISLSGTSMAAAVTSGAVALLVDSKPRLKPIPARLLLQLASTQTDRTGLIWSGAGLLSSVAAREVTQHSAKVPDTVVDGELSQHTGIAFANKALLALAEGIGARVSASHAEHTLGAAGRRDEGSVGWGSAQTIIWGSADTIIWGSADTIIWGSADTIIWGSADTIIWGSADTIIWGSADTIIWGSADTIIWGSADTIIWGSADTIIWGSADTIIWGSADTII
ncbi:MAG: S8 family serine peptidase [Vicinamibacterales bacterium]